MTSLPILYTLGHSNHSLERFLELLRLHKIETVGDVRSQPYSPYCPHFNRESLQIALLQNGIEYLFFGRELGARTEDTDCIIEGRVDYDCLTKTEAFREGVTRLKEEIKTKRVALVCAEKDPLTCHRTILVSRELRGETEKLRHILETGETETQKEVETRLLTSLKFEPSLFQSEAEQIEEAYGIQGRKIAYRV